ncbi:hypothetical protein K3495_g12816 [Podosphaera aphanis]|nr:hypothetical protein K3495_g12816 [Podosphaera aphanis]
MLGSTYNVCGLHYADGQESKDGSQTLRLQAGIYFFEASASGGKNDPLRAILGIAALKDLETDSRGIGSAFPHSCVQEEIYAELLQHQAFRAGISTLIASPEGFSTAVRG